MDFYSIQITSTHKETKFYKVKGSYPSAAAKKALDSFIGRPRDYKGEPLELHEVLTLKMYKI